MWVSTCSTVTTSLPLVANSGMTSPTRSSRASRPSPSSFHTVGRDDGAADRLEDVALVGRGVAVGLEGDQPAAPAPPPPGPTAAARPRPRAGPGAGTRRGGPDRRRLPWRIDELVVQRDHGARRARGQGWCRSCVTLRATTSSGMPAMDAHRNTVSTGASRGGGEMGPPPRRACRRRSGRAGRRDSVRRAAARGRPGEAPVATCPRPCAAGRSRTGRRHACDTIGQSASGSSVTHPLDAARHARRPDRVVAGLDQRVAVDRPQAGVDAQQTLAQQPGPAGALRPLVPHPDGQPRLARGRGDEPLPQPPQLDGRGRRWPGSGWPRSAPNSSNSGRRYPAPSPRSSRPPLTRSTSAACSASSTGWCSGATTMAVPIRASAYAPPPPPRR